MELDPPTLAFFSVVLSLAALVLAILALVLRGERFRARVETQLTTFNRTSEDILSTTAPDKLKPDCELSR